MKCKCHNEKREKDTLYKVVNDGKNSYYCSEQHYLNLKEAKESKDSVYALINDIFGYKVINTALFKELSEIDSVHSYVKIYSYMSSNIEQINKYMSRDFSSEYGKIRYLTTILKNNLADFKMPKNEPVKNQNAEIINVKYASKDRKKSLNDYIAEI